MDSIKKQKNLHLPVAAAESLQNVTENVAAIESDEESVTEPVAEEVKSSNNDLEERVKVLEEKLEKMFNELYRKFINKQLNFNQSKQDHPYPT